jgi:hypothetical protein
VYSPSMLPAAAAERYSSTARARLAPGGGGGGGGSAGGSERGGAGGCGTPRRRELRPAAAAATATQSMVPGAGWWRRWACAPLVLRSRGSRSRQSHMQAALPRRRPPPLQRLTPGQPPLVPIPQQVPRHQHPFRLVAGRGAQPQRQRQAVALRPPHHPAAVQQPGQVELRQAVALLRQQRVAQRGAPHIVLCAAAARSRGGGGGEKSAGERTGRRARPPPLVRPTNRSSGPEQVAASPCPPSPSPPPPILTRSAVGGLLPRLLPPPRHGHESPEGAQRAVGALGRAMQPVGVHQEELVRCPPGAQPHRGVEQLQRCAHVARHRVPPLVHGAQVVRSVVVLARSRRKVTEGLGHGRGGGGRRRGGRISKLPGPAGRQDHPWGKQACGGAQSMPRPVTSVPPLQKKPKPQPRAHLAHVGGHPLAVEVQHAQAVEGGGHPAGGGLQEVFPRPRKVLRVPIRGGGGGGRRRQRRHHRRHEGGGCKRPCGSGQHARCPAAGWSRPPGRLQRCPRQQGRHPPGGRASRGCA